MSRTIGSWRFGNRCRPPPPLQRRPGRRSRASSRTIASVASMLTEATEPLRTRDYHALRALAGTAPVTRRSGKQCFVIRRLACNKRLQNAVHHWSRVAIQHDTAARRRYDALRRRGHGHARALRTVGDRLLHALCAALKRQTPYNPNYQTAQVTTSL